MRLDDRGLAVARALGAVVTLEQLERRVTEALAPVSQAALLAFLHQLDAAYLLAGERSARQLRRRAAVAHDPALRFLAGTQHACVSCGASCTAHDVGPIAPARVAAIRALLGDSAHFRRVRSADPDIAGHYCGMDADRCAHLRPDRLCAIHALGGWEPKPTDCRVFPLAFTDTPAGPVVGVRMECRSYIASKRSGGALRDRGHELATLYGRVGSVEAAPAEVWLDGSLTVGWSDYAAVVPTLLAAVGEGDALAGLLSLNAAIRAFVDREAELERVAWLVPPSASPRRPTGVSREAVMALLAEGLADAEARNAAAGNVLRVGAVRRVAQALERLAAGPIRVPRLSDEDHELLRDHLRQSVHLADLATAPNVRYGAAVLSLSVLLAVAGMGQPEPLNGALADTLKVLRMGPVHDRLVAFDAPVADHLHDRLEAQVA